MTDQGPHSDRDTLIYTDTNHKDMIVNPKPVGQLKAHKLLQYISFAAFVFLTSSIVLLIRYSHIQSSSNEQNISSATASIIASAEIGKIIVGILYCLYDYNFNQNKSIIMAIQSVYNDIFGDKKILFLMSVPSFTYATQNFLMYMSLTLIPPSIYQIVIQLKTATTACFGICLLSKKYSCKQWIALILLSLGVILANLSVTQEKEQLNIRKIGLLYALGTTITSGFAGIFMEMQLKTNKNNIFIQNIQLSFFALIGCVVNSYFNNDMEQIYLYGYFYGYNKIVWIIVILNVVGGYFVAIVIKRASTMIKTFLSGIAVLLVIFVSHLFLDDHSIVHILFGVAVVLVLLANYMYNEDKVKMKYKKAVHVNPSSREL